MHTYSVMEGRGKDLSAKRGWMMDTEKVQINSLLLVPDSHIRRG